MRVSINTVKTAYDLLEIDRLVAPRPQSGYYVRHRLPEVPSEPSIRLETLVPTEATTGEIAAQIHRDIGRRTSCSSAPPFPPRRRCRRRPWLACWRGR